MSSHNRRDRSEVSALIGDAGGNLLYPDASATIFAEAEIGSGTKL